MSYYRAQVQDNQTIEYVFNIDDDVINAKCEEGLSKEDAVEELLSELTSLDDEAVERNVIYAFWNISEVTEVIEKFDNVDD